MARKKGDLNSSVQLLLDRIGKANGHACPSGGHNCDPDLHEYMIATMMESYAKKRREKAREEMENNIVDEATVNTIKQRALDNREAQPPTTLFSSDQSPYTLIVSVNKPAERVDPKKLKNKLIRDGRYTRDEVEKMYKAASSQNKPATSFVVTSRVDPAG